MPTPDVAFALLKSTFGYDRFRPRQEDIVAALLAGESVLAVMPTGSGKSMCYQLPALATEGLSVVVSPLIALMHDQVPLRHGAGQRRSRYRHRFRADTAWRTLLRACQPFVQLRPAPASRGVAHRDGGRLHRDNQRHQALACYLYVRL